MIVQKTFTNLNRELRELRQKFISDNHIECKNCQRYNEKKHTCNSELYCIVNDNVLFCAYIEKPDLAKIQPVNLYSDLTDDEASQLNLEMECTNPND